MLFQGSMHTLQEGLGLAGGISTPHPWRGGVKNHWHHIPRGMGGAVGGASQRCTSSNTAEAA